MVGAGDAARECALRHGTNARAAVPADVEKRANGARSIARDDDAFPREVPQEIVAWVRNAVGAAREDPGAEEKALHFGLEVFRRGVIAGWEREWRHLDSPGSLA